MTPSQLELEIRELASDIRSGVINTRSTSQTRLRRIISAVNTSHHNSDSDGDGHNRIAKSSAPSRDLENVDTDIGVSRPGSADDGEIVDFIRFTFEMKLTEPVILAATNYASHFGETADTIMYGICDYFSEVYGDDLNAVFYDKYAKRFTFSTTGRDECDRVIRAIEDDIEGAGPDRSDNTIYDPTNLFYTFKKRGIGITNVQMHDSEEQ